MELRQGPYFAANKSGRTVAANEVIEVELTPVVGPNDIPFWKLVDARGWASESNGVKKVLWETTESPGLPADAAKTPERRSIEGRRGVGDLMDALNEVASEDPSLDVGSKIAQQKQEIQGGDDPPSLTDVKASPQSLGEMEVTPTNLASWVPPMSDVAGRTGQETSDDQWYHLKGRGRIMDSRPPTQTMPTPEIVMGKVIRPGTMPGMVSRMLEDGAIAEGNEGRLGSEYEVDINEIVHPPPRPTPPVMETSVPARSARIEDWTIVPHRMGQQHIGVWTQRKERSRFLDRCAEGNEDKYFDPNLRLLEQIRRVRAEMCAARDEAMEEEATQARMMEQENARLKSEMSQIERNQRAQTQEMEERLREVSINARIVESHQQGRATEEHRRRHDIWNGGYAEGTEVAKRTENQIVRDTNLFWEQREQRIKAEWAEEMRSKTLWENTRVREVKSEMRAESEQRRETAEMARGSKRL